MEPSEGPSASAAGLPLSMSAEDEAAFIDSFFCPGGILDPILHQQDSDEVPTGKASKLAPIGNQIHSTSDISSSDHDLTTSVPTTTMGHATTTTTNSVENIEGWLPSHPAPTLCDSLWGTSTSSERLTLSSTAASMEPTALFPPVLVEQDSVGIQALAASLGNPHSLESLNQSSAALVVNLATNDLIVTEQRQRPQIVQTTSVSSFFHHHHHHLAVPSATEHADQDDHNDDVHRMVRTLSDNLLGEYYLVDELMVQQPESPPKIVRRPHHPASPEEDHDIERHQQQPRSLSLLENDGLGPVVPLGLASPVPQHCMANNDYPKPHVSKVQQQADPHQNHHHHHERHSVTSSLSSSTVEQDDADEDHDHGQVMNNRAEQSTKIENMERLSEAQYAAEVLMPVPEKSKIKWSQMAAEGAAKGGVVQQQQQQSPLATSSPPAAVGPGVVKKQRKPRGSNVATLTQSTTPTPQAGQRGPSAAVVELKTEFKPVAFAKKQPVHNATSGRTKKSAVVVLSSEDVVSAGGSQNSAEHFHQDARVALLVPRVSEVHGPPKTSSQEIHKKENATSQERTTRHGTTDATPRNDDDGGKFDGTSRGITIGSGGMRKETTALSDNMKSHSNFNTNSTATEPTRVYKQGKSRKAPKKTNQPRTSDKSTASNVVRTQSVGGFQVTFPLTRVAVRLTQRLVCGTSSIIHQSAEEAREHPELAVVYAALYFVPMISSYFMESSSYLPYFFPGLLYAETLHMVCSDVWGEPAIQRNNLILSQFETASSLQTLGASSKNALKKTNSNGAANNRASMTPSSKSLSSNHDRALKVRQQAEHLEGEIGQHVLNVYQYVIPVVMAAFCLHSPNSAFAVEFMVSINSARIIAAFVLCTCRTCNMLSPIAWISWSLQILVATNSHSSYEGTILFDVMRDALLVVIGLASLRFIRRLNDQSLRRVAATGA